jgi:hypothetical protein
MSSSPENTFVLGGDDAVINNFGLFNHFVAAASAVSGKFTNNGKIFAATGSLGNLG